MHKRSELIFNLILLPIDFIAVTAAFILAYVIRVKIDGRPVANPLGIVLFLKLFLLIIPVWILIFALAGLYTQTGLRSRWNELGKIFVGVSGGTMSMILVDFASKQPIFPAKSIPIYGYGLSLLFVALGRQIVRGIQHYCFNFGIGVRRTMIIGSGEIAQRLLSDLSRKNSGYHIIGVIDTARNADKRMKHLPIFSDLDSAIARFKRHGIEEFIQADSALPPEDIMSILDFAGSHHMAFRFVPNQFGVYATNTTMSTMAGMPVVEIKHTPLDGWGRIVKRMFDLLGAGFGLLVASPFMLLIALIMKLTDPGPVFYRQPRLTRNNEPINILKFRTMYLKYSTGDGYGAKDDAAAFKALGKPELINEFSLENKLAKDPRVTPLGRFLRKTSLDELPQLLNVLRGDLSLVGPRPMLATELDRFGQHLATILALKCGITGLWQVSGRTDVGFEGRVKFDIFYVENWSLWLDIKILLKTVLMVIRGRGAY